MTVTWGPDVVWKVGGAGGGNTGMTFLAHAL